MCGEAGWEVQNVRKRLNACRRELKCWSKVEFPNSKKAIDELLLELRMCWERRLTKAKKLRIEEIIGKTEELWDREEMY